MDSEPSQDALIQLSHMIKSFQFTGANFQHRNNEDKSPADLVLESMNTISFEVRELRILETIFLNLFLHLFL